MSIFCKTCGAAASEGMVQCLYCNASIEEGARTYDKFLQSFSARYQELAFSKDKKVKASRRLENLAALVSSINVPSDRGALIQLTAYVSGQVRSIGDNYATTNKELAAIVLPSWLAKAREISLKLRLTTINDDQAVLAIEELDKLDAYKSASTQISHATFLSKLRWRLFFPVAIIATIRLVQILFDDGSTEKEKIMPFMVTAVGGWIAFFVTKKHSKDSK
jgi:hypothetical protein